MFIYLSKKIAIPNNTKLNAIAWNKEDEYIAVGGEGGLLKVLKLDAVVENDVNVKNKGLAISSNLSMNQTLEGHGESVQVLVWNESHKKLTTSDNNGVIIVWMLYKGAWYEEMINNRKKSTVVGMAWTADGYKICIIYEDGAVIVGSVDGNRIWGKEFKNVSLSGVQWSPDGKLLIFSLKNGQLHLYDNQGTFIMQIECYSIEITLETISVVGLDWYNGLKGYMHALCPNLAIVYENGRAQLMRNESDLNPVLLETKMAAVHCSWNHNGSLLAISGRQHSEEKGVNLIQFYNPFGEHMRTLKVPGNSISCCVWEGKSLRVALAVDSFVYFANIRPDYKWCYFKKTVVFASCKFQKSGICVSFWETNTNQCHSLHIPILLGLYGYQDHCILVTRSDIDDASGEYKLMLCNTLGTVVDGIYINMEPIGVTMNSTDVIVIAKNNFMIWQYQTPKSSIVIGSRNKSKLFHIDDNPTGAVQVIQDLDNDKQATIATHDTSDPICCSCCSDKCIIIGRESGLLHYYALPHIILTNKYKIANRPDKVAINCNSTRVSVIDVAGIMTVLDISDAIGRITSKTGENKLERKDVWAMCWASDNPQLLAIMEKTRMYIFKGIYPEEPISCSGYICCFDDLEIQTVLLDELMETTEHPSNKDHLIKLEVKSLRDTRQLLEKVGIKEAALFIEENPHPRLWRLLAEAALKQMNLLIAESAFVRSRDYAKVVFVKKLKDINSEPIRRARIETYLKNFDEAEKIYVENDRSDLALTLRHILGDWFRVIQILKNGVTAPDYFLKLAYNATAEYFVHLNNWAAAIEYYELGDNTLGLIDCYQHLEEYKMLEKLIDHFPEENNKLKTIGDIFASHAACNEAVLAYCKYGNVNDAIDLCILHNRWHVAIDLAKKFNIKKISDLFIKYTTHLEEQNLYFTAIDINIKAQFYLNAAKHVFKIANTQSKKNNKNLLQLKKYYVYGARLLQLHKQSLQSSDSMEWDHDSILDKNIWKGAEAYHFYMLAQGQLYSGKFHDALCTCYKLQDYIKYIQPVEVYSLLALTAYLDRSFDICSKAFIKLKKLSEKFSHYRNQIEKLTWDIFLKYEPNNFRCSEVKCLNCQQFIPDWRTRCSKCKIHFTTCTITGKSIIDGTTETWLCSVCHHPAVEAQATFLNSCLLCHHTK